MARLYGVHRGVVLDDVDPSGAGRLRVEVPTAYVRGAWAAVAGLPAAAGSPVIVAFEEGDPTRPVVLGGLPGANGAWNLPGGASLRLDAAARVLALDDGQGNVVTVSSAGVTVQVAAQVHVSASSVRVDAGMVQVDTGMFRVSGVVQADTVVTNTVVATSYTPGAGNLW